MSRIQYFL
uniref:Uncharacterized protein n=1 Tax=Arundo donax TaxID=35708 RepID=A0A0A8ZJW2_ARUDO